MDPIYIYILVVAIPLLAAMGVVLYQEGKENEEKKRAGEQ